MDAWIILSVAAISFAAKFLLSNAAKKKNTLPPGPPSIPVISTLLWLKKSISNINSIFRELRVKYGPILTLRIASRTAVLVADREFAHKALVLYGTAFADRPPAPKVKSDLVGKNLINQLPYGAMWRVLRGNLTNKLLHPSRIRNFAGGRRWAHHTLLDKLKHNAKLGDGVVVPGVSFQDTVYGLMLFMCFGEKLGGDRIEEIKSLMKSFESGMTKVNVFAFCPGITKLAFKKRWNALVEIRRKNVEIFVPLIRSREEIKKKEDDSLYPYVDSLLDLRIPEEGGRRLSEDEVVSLCTELLLVGAGTTYTSLEWIMAGIVIHQEVQKKLLEEICGVVEHHEDEIKEDQLLRMPYLKAVILEGMRRYPLSYFGAPHAVIKATEIADYVIPKDALILFMISEMSWDEKVWEEPMEFRPERFLEGGEGEGIDITGNREVKMIPFGAGRRICPGIGLAMLHLQYFVANLVREFEWKAVDGEEIDLSARWENSLAMKNPLRARITPRRNKRTAEMEIILDV